MDATYIQKSMTQYKTAVFMHVRHRTLQRFTGDPVINENQMFYLLLPFLNGEPYEQQQHAATIVGVVHAALAAHDLIKEQDATSKEQQLTVLAGDYYSGRYYQILAASGDISLIRSISQAIIERCEANTALYEAQTRSVAEWLDALTIVESVLIAAFFGHANLQQYTPIMQTSVTLLRLQQELEAANNHVASRWWQCAERDYTGDFTGFIAEHIAMLQQQRTAQVENATFLQPTLKQLVLGNVSFQAMTKSEV